MNIRRSCGTITGDGPLIDSAATSLLVFGVISPESVANQMKRDRGTHHMTLITKNELRNLSVPEDEILARFEAATVEGKPPVSLGLGQTSHAYYVVMHWPVGNTVRIFYGLPPKDFHITLGFGDSGDVHDVPKGPATLCVLRQGPEVVPCVKGSLEQLSEIGLQLSSETPPSEDAYHVLSAAIAYQPHARLLTKLYNARCFLAKFMPSLTELEDALALVALDPTFPSGYVRVGDAHLRLRNVQNTSVAYWTALYVAGTGHVNAMTEYCVNALASLLVKHPHDLVLRPMDSFGPYFSNAVGEGAKASPFSCLVSSGQLVATERHYFPLVVTRYYKLRGDSAVTDMEESTERRLVLKVDGSTHSLPRNFSWIVPNFLCGMSTPRNGEDIIAMRDSLGITVVVTATREEPLKKEWFMGGIKNAFLPVDNYYPPSCELADAFLELCETEYAKGGRVLMHCGGGKGRAGSFLAAYLIRYGVNPPTAPGKEPLMSPTDAITLLRTARPGSIETQKQEEFCHAFASHLWKKWHEEEVPDEDMTADRMVVVTKPGVIPAVTPTFVFLVGLPGCGKSFFAQRLEAEGGFVRVSQDDLNGSRRDTEDAFSRAAKSGRNSVVLDRCNPTVADRKAFLELAFKPDPRQVICVYFAVAPHTCLRRANRRFDHPTIEIGRAERAVEHFVGVLEVPTVAEGFGQVVTVSTFTDVCKLLSTRFLM